MDSYTKKDLATSLEISGEIMSTVSRLNKLLEKASDIGLDVLLQKEESSGQRTRKTSITVVKATYRVEFVQDSIKPG